MTYKYFMPLSYLRAPSWGALSLCVCLCLRVHLSMRRQRRWLGAMQRTQDGCGVFALKMKQNLMNNVTPRLLCVWIIFFGFAFNRAHLTLNSRLAHLRRRHFMASPKFSLLHARIENCLFAAHSDGERESRIFSNLYGVWLRPHEFYWLSEWFEILNNILSIAPLSRKPHSSLVGI